MTRNRSLFGLLALIGALTVVYSSSASAEFFTCNQRPGQVLYSYAGTPDAYIRRQHRSYSAPRYSSRPTRTYAARPHRRHTTYYNDTRYWNGR